MTGNAFRRFIAALAAYLVVLHAIGMGVMAAPAADGGSLPVICNIEADASAPIAPAHGPAEHAPCALCGLGACAIAPPSAHAMPLPGAIASIVAPPAALWMARPVPALDAASPRGPPLAA